jgi:Mn2+/Fe2+ NRAMP family transporter
MCSIKNCFPRHWLLAYVTKISFLKRWSSATDVNHTFASVWLVMIQSIYNTFNFVCAQINWSPACPRSVYQHIHEIKSTLNITYLVSRWLQDTGISISVLLLIIPPSHIILWYCDMSKELMLTLVWPKHTNIVFIFSLLFFRYSNMITFLLQNW